MSTGEYWPELENNHHYIIVDSEHDRTFYCPAEEVANTLSRILNDKNKTIRNKNKTIHNLKEAYDELSREKIIYVPTFEIVRKFPDREECHVAYVTNEALAFHFCNQHKDCSYYEVPITKNLKGLESLRDHIPTCDNCFKFSQGGLADLISKAENKDGICDITDDAVNYDDYCSEWEGEEE